MSALATTQLDREPREARESSDEETLTRGEVLRFLYTCPQAILMTTLQGHVRLMSARAVSLLIPFSETGAIDDVFELFEKHEPRFRERLAEGMAQPERRLEGMRIKVAEGTRGAPAWIEVSAVPFDGGYSLTCHDATAAVEREGRYLAAVADEAHQRGKTETASSATCSSRSAPGSTPTRPRSRRSATAWRSAPASARSPTRTRPCRS